MSNKKSGGFISRFSTIVVDKRNLIFVLYIFAAIFSVFAMGWTQVENDVTKYLSEDTETRQGLDAMNSAFVTYGTAEVMVANITYETAEVLAEQIAQVDGVAAVSFDDSAERYTEASALFSVNFSGLAQDESTLQALDEIRGLLAGYDVYIYSDIGYSDVDMLRDEMLVIFIVAAIIIMIVLTLTTNAYMEVPVLLITFGAAALLNMGTNFIFGTVSFISDAVAVVLQLALAIDYAIILTHRFSAEHENLAAREAAIAALEKAVPEVGASSLTTVSGLAALGFMEFGIGLDLALVLIKAIFLSLLSVFTLMPGLLVLFSPLIDRTRHKKLLPDVSFLGTFAVKARRCIPPLFIVVLVAAFVLSSQCPFAYSINDIKTAKITDRQTAYFKIKDTFGTNNMVALVLPSGNYEAEQALAEELSARPEVKNVMGLSTIEIMDGYTLTDSLTPREFSELVDLDYEVAQMLYTAYAVQEEEYGRLLSGLDEYRIPLFDMFINLKDQLETYNITLSDTGGMSMDDMFAQLDTARNQLQNDRYSRMLVYVNLPEEGEETYAFLAELRSIIGQYYEDDYYVVGNSTSSRDLSESFATDNLVISLLSALFVILVVLFTFQSVGLPVLLILVIQGAIWINFSIPTLIDQPLYFLGYLIVNAIQMGANIDYAIVLSSHYQEQKKFMPHKQAIVQAINSAFPTVFTSGTMLASAGLLIGNLSAQPTVAIMGTCLGRGTLISMALVLFVLPAFLVLGDSIINRTSFKLKTIEPKVKAASGTVRVQGHVRGYISGVVDADFDGILHGQLNASISTDGRITEEGGAEDE